MLLAIPYNEAPTHPFCLTNSNTLSTLGAGILGSNHITFALALKEMGKGKGPFVPDNNFKFNH